MNQREYLRSQGFQVGDRGRFSAAMKDALKSASPGSYAIPEQTTIVKSTDLKPKNQGIKIDRPKSTADPKAVRAWAKANGFEVGDRGRIKPEVFAAYEAANTDKDIPQRSETPRGVKDVRPHSEPLVPIDTQWQYIDPTGKKWVVSGKTACSQTSTSIAYCPEGEGHQHTVVVGDVRLGLVPVTKV